MITGMYVASGNTKPMPSANDDESSLSRLSENLQIIVNPGDKVSPLSMSIRRTRRSLSHTRAETPTVVMLTPIRSAYITDRIRADNRLSFFIIFTSVSNHADCFSFFFLIENIRSKVSPAPMINPAAAPIAIEPPENSEPAAVRSLTGVVSCLK